MKEVTFNYIWTEVVEKAINNIENSFQTSEKERYHFKKNNLYLLKKQIYKDYDDIKNFLKKHYYDTSKKTQSTQNRIDNHKIAACICYSFIQNKVFSFNVEDDMPKRMFTINYEVAYSVSLGFLYTTLLAQYRRNKKYDYAEKLVEQGKMLVPETSEGHDEYHEGRIHTLALNDIYGNAFDLLTYSDMMFWIEYYNRQKIEDTLDPMNLWTEN